MGKKYLDTKKGSLEQSILGVWQTAIEEKDARMDGRTKEYREHRAKLEAARLRREKKNLNKEEVELDEASVMVDLENDNPKLMKDIKKMGIKRLGTSEEVANTIMFLASDKSSYITGQIIRIDGGIK